MEYCTFNKSRKTSPPSPTLYSPLQLHKGRRAAQYQCAHPDDKVHETLVALVMDKNVITLLVSLKTTAMKSINNSHK